MFGFPFPVVVSACLFVPAYNASNEHDTICIGLTRIAYGMQPSPYITCARGNRCRVHCHRFHSFYIRQNLRPGTLDPRESLPLRSRCLPCFEDNVMLPMQTQGTTWTPVLGEWKSPPKLGEGKKRKNMNKCQWHLNGQVSVAL